MTIRHLRIFIEVAECGKMSLAAERLFIAQPSVSQAISEIERHYCIRLFERLSRKLYITPEGEQMLGYARHIVALFDEMEKAIQTSRSSPVKVGATVTVGTCVLSDIVTSFKSLHQDTEVDVFVDNTKKIEEKLLKSELDLAVVEGRISSRELVVEPIMEDNLVLICGEGHPFFHREKVSGEELNGQDFVLREVGSGTRELFQSYVQSMGYSINERWTCNNSDAIKRAVSCNHGLSVISARLVKEESDTGKLHVVEIDGCPFNRNFSLVYHKNKYFSEHISSFADTCREFLDVR